MIHQKYRIEFAHFQEEKVQRMHWFCGRILNVLLRLRKHQRTSSEFIEQIKNQMWNKRTLSYSNQFKFYYSEIRFTCTHEMMTMHRRCWRSKDREIQWNVKSDRDNDAECRGAMKQKTKDETNSPMRPDIFRILTFLSASLLSFNVNFCFSSFHLFRFVVILLSFWFSALRKKPHKQNLFRRHYITFFAAFHVSIMLFVLFLFSLTQFPFRSLGTFFVNTNRDPPFARGVLPEFTLNDNLTETTTEALPDAV